MPGAAAMDHPARHRLLLVASFATLYLVWGSTYLFILYAIETIPPLVMAGARHLVAGILLWVFLPKPEPKPTLRDWAWAFLLGTLMLAIGNGAVTVAEGKMPSGVAALLVAAVPLWLVVLEWGSGTKPRPLVLAAIPLGLAGVAILANTNEGWKGGKVEPLYVVAVVLGALCWAAGSLLSRRGPIKMPLLRAVALQMMAGGVVLAVAGAATGELHGFDPSAISAKSWLSWAYLVLFGSVAAFSAYSWLLRVVPAPLAGTYAFVNPVVAVVLGAAWANEPVGPRVLLATGLIVAAVALVSIAKARKATPQATPAPADS